MFLFCEPGLSHPAYFIIPDENGELIKHQYGCVSCLDFDIKGRIEKVPDEIANKLTTLLGCETASAEAIRLETGLDVDYVLDEALMKLKDGRYVATNNCD